MGTTATLPILQATLNHVEDAHRLVDEAISAALVHKKPAYIEVFKIQFFYMLCMLCV
jgi:TPP-dependent 2-oxoacid decarboxylase